VIFLADMGVSPVTVQALRQQGYDAVHLNEQGLERLPDSEILEKARQEQTLNPAVETASTRTKPACAG
jgi:predicted nuclease of predicted toxin-antitoxin system